jgi:TatD DNase family protein
MEITKERQAMKLFDSHAHLDDASYHDDMDDVLDRAKTAGVEAVMLVGITEKNSEKLIRMATDHPMFYSSVGIHPHDASKASVSAIEHLKTLAVKHDVVKAWGETGLDFARMHSPRPVQELWFERQMDAAAELDLPLIFHERDSGGRFLDMVTHHSKNSHLKGVVHCFSGSSDEMKSYLDLGLYIGITGIITVKARGVDLREQVIHIPEDRLLIETDAPYLTPTPERNKHKRNEPAFVRTTLLKLAEVRGDDPEGLAEVIWNNTMNLYRIER